VERTDQELLEALRSGDTEAVDALVARYEPAVYRFGLRMCRDEEDAKDVLQDTLLAATRGARDFRGESSLSSWLYTIARSFCIKKRRKGKHAPEAIVPLDDAGAAHAGTAAPDEAAAAKELRTALEHAIGSLEPLYREVLLLRDVEGLTAPEVAGALGIGVDAVKSRLHRARTAVRSRLAPVLGAPAQTGPGCPDVVEMLSRHLEGEIGPDDCARMESHLAGCPTCSAACDSLRRTLALCRRERDAAVPAEVQASVRDAIRVALEDKGWKNGRAG
jgi:RNA polymerase sigma-70 factor (ECF subfamily)